MWQLRVLGRLVGESMPVKFVSSPRRALGRGPCGRGASATASGVSTKTSMNSPSPTSSRAIRRSARKGEMNDTSTISPASTISVATSATRRMFSTRSASVKPRSLVEPVADVVAVEQVGVAADGVQLALDQVGDGRLAGAGEPGEPDHARPLALQGGAGRLVDLDRLPVDVVAPGAGRSAAARRRPCRWCSRSMRMKPPMSRFSA